jgi:sensor histidine kinase YesM
MKCWFSPIIIVLCIAAKTAAQSPAELDSLLGVLHSQSQDSLKVQTYYLISEFYASTRKHFDLAKAYADSAHQLAKTIQWPEGEALSAYNRALIQRHEGDLREGMRNLDQFIIFFQHKGDSLKVAKGIYQKGVISNNLGDYDKSLAFYLRALPIYEINKRWKNAANVLNSIGNIYKRTKRVQESLEFYKKANTIYQKLGDDKEFAMGLSGLGSAHAMLKQYDTAKLYYNEALRRIDSLGHDSETALVLGNLGNVYSNELKFKEALPYHLRALKIWRTLPQKKSLANCLNNIGNVYLHLADHNQAERYFKESLKHAKDVGSMEQLSDIYGQLNEVYLAKKDFEKAYTYFKLSTQLKDSIYNAENAKILNEMQERYESREKEKEIAVLSAENEFKEERIQRETFLRSVSIAALALVVLVAAMIFYISRQRIRNQRIMSEKDKEIKDLEFRRQRAELEIKALQAQVNPHFLFNCLNSINRMILESDNVNASLYLSKFSKLMRSILENADSSKVTLQSELSLLENYIQLEALRFRGKIDYEITVDENINRDDIYLPSMILQPFVENAIWHGLMHKPDSEEKGLIRIKVVEENNRLRCTIEDNGIGRKKAREHAAAAFVKSKSLGMKITQERLRLFTNEVEDLIHVTDLIDGANNSMGTRVDITLPVA